MTVEERAQFTCSKLCATVVSMRDRKIVDNMRQRQARNGMTAAPAQWHRTGGSTRTDEQGRVPAWGLEGRMFPVPHEGNADAMRLAAEVFGQAPGSREGMVVAAHADNADAMRLAAEIFGPTVRLQAPDICSSQERTAAATMTEEEARDADTSVAASSAKAPAPDTTSTGGAAPTPSAPCSAAPSFGYSSAKAPAPVAASTQGSSSTSGVFGTGAGRVEAPVTGTMGVSFTAVRVVTSAPAFAGGSSAKMPDMQTSFTGIKLTTSRVLTSAPALPLQANNTASPVQGSELMVKFRLGELVGQERLKKKLKLQHTERTSLPFNGASFSDVLCNAHARQAVVSQLCAENTQAVLPIKREDVEDGK